MSENQQRDDYDTPIPRRQFNASVLGYVTEHAPVELRPKVRKMVQEDKYLSPADIADRADVELTRNNAEEIAEAIEAKWRDGTLRGSLDYTLRKGEAEWE